MDLKLAARSLLRTPAFTAVAVATIAFGIGVTGANFSIVTEILVRPIALDDLDRLVMIQSKGRGDFQFDDYASSPRAYLDWTRETRSFEGLAAYRLTNVNLLGAGGPPEYVRGSRVSPEFFPLLRPRAALGRALLADEVAQRRDVVVLSDGLWRRRYAADPAIVGQTIQLNGESHLVAGVMPPSFRLPYAAELWLPLKLSPADRDDRALRDLAVVGRLRPGQTVAAADAEMRTVGARHAQLFPTSDAGRSLRAVSLRRGLTEDSTRSFIHTMMAGSLFVLLVVCLNVANLLLARGSVRRRELAVRAALGASRGRLTRLLLAESLLLALLAGALSLLVAAWSLELIRNGVSPSITRNLPGWDRLEINGAVLGYTLAAALATALAFGLAPALQLTRTPVGQALGESARTSTASRPLRRLRSALVVAQVAMALVLLAGAGALLAGVQRNANPRRGLDPDGVLTMQVVLRGDRYQARDQLLEFQRRTVAELAALPGVAGAAAASSIPWGNFAQSEPVHFDGRPPPRPGEVPAIELRAITPGYLELLRIPLLAGEPLGARDARPEAGRRALISASAARRFWPGGNAIGRQFRTGAASGDGGTVWTVGGIVGDVHHHWLRHPLPTMYVAAAHAVSAQMYLVLRLAGAGDPARLAPAAQAAVNRIDPELPVSNIRPLEQVLADRVSGTRVGSLMMGGFAAMALLLAALGIHGVVAYLVAQRHREIGIRLALGARAGQVLRLVMGRGVRLTLVGLALGLPGAVLVTRVLATFLADLIDTDVASLLLFTLMVAALALLSTFLPARRATRVDPMVALRSE